MAKTHFTEPTTSYWQEILPQDHSLVSSSPPWQNGVPVLLPNSRVLVLPIRSLNNAKNEGIASLLITEASMVVSEELSCLLAERVKPFAPDVIIGLPTLGLTIAPIVAKELGQDRYIPLGYSKKFWYEDDLSAEVSSITSLDTKKVYLDPHLLLLVKGKKVAIIDDAVSSGTTLRACWDLLEKVGCEVVVCGVVMKQGDKWKEILGDERTERLVYVLESPLLVAVENGWDVRP